ncbi:MAG: methyltransferase domain-containing protein [Alistipes sp.]|nr:methyltransferase domain-containing protein [Alistipes sp.]
MAKGIRWALNAVPRPWLQRIAGWAVPVIGILYAGRGRVCPVCNTRRREFLPYGYVTSRKDALCPGCLALERHRLLWLYLTRETTLFATHPTLLHIAPEVTLMRRLRHHYKGVPERYITADLESPLADMHFDVQSIPMEAESVDVVICNHLLEHVESDRRALSELHRILRPGGWGVLLSPIDYEREHTFEDDSVTDAEERAKIFGQYDHRRIYGRDYTQRLSETGFIAEEIDYAAQFTEQEREQYSLGNDRLYIVRKPETETEK